MGCFVEGIMAEMKSFPLCWPAGWKRATSSTRDGGPMRKRAKFSKAGAGSYQTQLSVNDGTQRVLLEIARLGISRDDMIISTNVKVRLDGLPYSDQKEPADPGAAVYWKNKAGQTKCIAIDIYDRVADNLGAIAASIDAMRAIERHGGAEILERVFTGFTALPAPDQWREVLGFPHNSVSLKEAEQRYRELAKKHHPDNGGSALEFSRIAKAIDEARKELS
jgi:hypothetical protein